MGYAYDCLIPAAILYNQPGLTREEFVTAIAPAEQVKSKYWGGLEALAHILHLKQFAGSFDGDVRQFMGIKRHNTLPYYQEYAEGTFSGESRDTKQIQVVACNHRELPLEEFTLKSNSGYKESQAVGKDYFDLLLEREYHLDEAEKEKCRTFLNTRLSGVRIEKIINQSRPAGTGMLIEQKIIVTPFEIYEEKKKVYSSPEQLFADYPRLHPDKRFDWTQEQGVLCVTDFDRKPLYWFKRDERYYFDEQQARRTLTGNKYPGENWVDLILTAEAVKKKFWKILEYRGLQHEYEFFIKHPDVLQAYNRARWDSDTSLSAKQRGMTNTDFLRFRLEHGGNIHETNPQRLKTTILACLEKLQIWAEDEKKRCLPGENVRFKYDFTSEEIEQFVELAVKR